MLYGYTVESHGSDPLIDLVDKAFNQFLAAVAPGAWAVDTIPARMHFYMMRNPDAYG